MYSRCELAVCLRHRCVHGLYIWSCHAHIDLTEAIQMSSSQAHTPNLRWRGPPKLVITLPSRAASHVKMHHRAAISTITSEHCAPSQELRQALLDQLDFSKPARSPYLPNEMILMIVEKLMTENQQPVHLMSKMPVPFLRAESLKDPFDELCGRYTQGLIASPSLLALMRQTYFKVNTIRLDAPSYRSPPQIFRYPTFTMPFAKDLQSLELNLPFEARIAHPVWYPGDGHDFYRTNIFNLMEHDIRRIITILHRLSEAFPKLRRLTLMLTVECDVDVSSLCYQYEGTRVGDKSLQFGALASHGQLCCLLDGQASNVMRVFRQIIVEVMLAIEFNFAAFKWRTACGHKKCKKWLAGNEEVVRGTFRIVEDEQYSTVVVLNRKRKMARLA